MICSRCKKRNATIFIQRLEGSNITNDGLCIKCARELGISAVDDMLKKTGMSEEQIEMLMEEIEDYNLDAPAQADGGDADKSLTSSSETDDGRAPAMDLSSLIKGMRDNLNSFASSNDQSGAKEGRADRESEKFAQKKSSGERKNLKSFCIDLTGRAREGKIDSIIGRDTELARVEQILCRRQKNNPCLIGEPGVGKTAIAEGLALRIAQGNAPYKLRDKEVHLLDLTSIVAGTQFRGQFEARMKGLIEEVKRLGNIILVIDEVHSIVGAGDAEGSMNAANILKPSLSRGDVQVIGATTLGEYRKYIEKDSALERRFQPIIVKEPSVDESAEILLGIKNYYETFHGIKIPDETVRQAVILSERYITDRFLPDKAIDLLDESSSYLALHSPVIEEIDVIAAQLKEINQSIEGLETSGDTESFEKLAALKVEKYRMMGKFDELSHRRDDIVLNVEHLAKVIEIWTGVPASNISENEFARLDGLFGRLSSRIVGQDTAIDAVVRAVKRSRAGIAYKRKPISFIFSGPTGVGKTELVKTLALDLFNTPESLIRLDMSEFMEKFSVSRIIGAPPGYVGYDEAGQLTEKVRRKPYCVILFDEIEKAHPDVMNILLQILDDGRITDAQGRVVNFENTIVIMTTNASNNMASATAGFSISDTTTYDEDKTLKALGEFLRPEFINRVDEIISFSQLEIPDFLRITGILLGDLQRTLAEKAISFTFSQAAIEKLAELSFSRKYGARNIRRTIQTKVEDCIANLVVANTTSAAQSFTLDVSEGELIVMAL